MKTLFRVLPFLIGILIYTNCNDDNIPKNEEDYLVFGAYSGFCVGDCFTVYKLTQEKLFEDNDTHHLGDYEEYFFSGEELSEAKFELVKDLINGIPNELFKLANKKFGCPDCVDQGSIYIEIEVDGINRRYLIDPVDFEGESEELKAFKGRVLSAISMLQE